MSRALKRRTYACVVALAVALVSGAGCAQIDPTTVAVEAGAGAGLAASDGTGTDETNTEDAARFEPVDPRPIGPTPPPPTSPPPASPTSLPYPSPTPYDGVPGLVPVPDGLGNPPAIPAGPPPGMLGGVNECPGVVFENPAQFVWGTDSDGSAGGLWVREEPSVDSPTVRLMARNALAQFMTAGCRPGADGTPWFEFGSSTGELGYANSRFLVQAQPSCLTSDVEAVRSVDETASITLTAGTYGHAYADGGPFAGFIPNEDIGSIDLYWLVPADTVLISPGDNQTVPPCEAS